jgi:hypothetical protein
MVISHKSSYHINKLIVQRALEGLSAQGASLDYKEILAFLEVKVALAQKET